MSALTRHRRWLGIALFGVAILAAAVVGLRRPPSKPGFFDPTRAAAYSSLVAIASQLTGELSGTNRAEYLAQNRNTIQSGRKAIKDPIEMPEALYHTNNLDMRGLRDLKQLAFALVAEGQAAEGENRFRDAANIYFDTIRLGERVAHGPLINHLVGNAIERAGLKPMELILAKLSDRDLMELASNLQTFNQNRIKFDEVLEHEDYFLALTAKSVVDAARVRFSARTRRVIETTRESHNALRAQVEITAATMAMIRYTRENGASLTDVALLAPKYLAKTPMDPFSNQPLLLSANSTNAPIIYSVGPNRRDDHGKADDIVSMHRDSTWFRALSNVMSPQ